MSSFREDMDLLSRRWSFRVMIVGLPIAASCFFGESVLAIGWATRQNPVSFIIDVIPAISALIVAAAFIYVLPARAACEGRHPDRTAWLYLAASTFFGAWAGGCISQILNLRHYAHHPMLLTETFGQITSEVALVINAAAILILSLEILKRCPIVPESGC